MYKHIKYLYAIVEHMKRTSEGTRAKKKKKNSHCFWSRNSGTSYTENEKYSGESNTVWAAASDHIQTV